MENRKVTNCNQCPNHCPADGPKCGKGRRYFEQLENPDTHDPEAYENREGHPHGREGARRHGKPEDLYGLMRACGHYLHHSGRMSQEEGGLFAALSETEQESLKGILRKLLKSWEQGTEESEKA